jgi:hypothetical protein
MVFLSAVTPSIRSASFPPDFKGLRAGYPRTETKQISHQKPLPWDDGMCSDEWIVTGKGRGSDEPKKIEWGRFTDPRQEGNAGAFRDWQS